MACFALVSAGFFDALNAVLFVSAVSDHVLEMPCYRSGKQGWGIQGVYSRHLSTMGLSIFGQRKLTLDAKLKRTAPRQKACGHIKIINDNHCFFD